MFCSAHGFTVVLLAIASKIRTETVFPLVCTRSHLEAMTRMSSVQLTLKCVLL